MKSFQDEIAAIVNRYNMEKGSNTPDFILAEFMFKCLDTFAQTTRQRDAHRNVENEGYWKSRCLCVEDLLEAVSVWQETMIKETRCEQIQSRVAHLRRIYEREGKPMVCRELMPYGVHDSWISIEERKPTLATPIVEVMFNNFEIEESRFWTGYFEHDFQRFEVSRPGYEITHWRPKEKES